MENLRCVPDNSRSGEKKLHGNRFSYNHIDPYEFRCHVRSRNYGKLFVGKTGGSLVLDRSERWINPAGSKQHSTWGYHCHGSLADSS